MLNKAPIFVNGFQHGGTNILVNLLVSHPDVCLVGETQRVFYGSDKELFLKRWTHRLFYIPIFIGARQHIFWPERFYERRKLPRLLMHYTDLLFYWNKFIAPHNKLKDESTPYSKGDIAKARLLCKNVNGVVFTTPVLADMYPDATFIGLLRNGLALCEGFIRRGWTAERFGKAYECVCQQMIRDANRMSNYHLIRFEDIISDPVRSAQEVYAYAHLDIDAVPRFRLQAKKSMSREGVRQYAFGGETDREIHWFALDQLRDQIQADVNENQIARLSLQDKQTFLHFAHNSMEYLGYC